MSDFQRVFTVAILGKAFTLSRPRNRRAAIERNIRNNVLNEKDRQIMRRRFLDGLTLEELAEEFGFSVEGIKREIRKYKAWI